MRRLANLASSGVRDRVTLDALERGERRIILDTVAVHLRLDAGARLEARGWRYEVWSGAGTSELQTVRFLSGFRRTLPGSVTGGADVSGTQWCPIRLGVPVRPSGKYPRCDLGKVSGGAVGRRVGARTDAIENARHALPVSSLGFLSGDDGRWRTDLDLNGRRSGLRLRLGCNGLRVALPSVHPVAVVTCRWRFRCIPARIRERSTNAKTCIPGKRCHSSGVGFGARGVRGHIIPDFIPNFAPE